MSLYIKNIILALAVTLFSVASFANEPYCEGFKAGFKEGYMQAKNTLIVPLTPLCPVLRPLNIFGDAKSDYEYGYELGLKKGLSKG